MESTPGPWYSTMAPVPPFTVRMPATFKMTSLGDVQPERVPVSFTPITFEKRLESSVWQIKAQRWRKKNTTNVTGERKHGKHETEDIVNKILYSANLGALELPGNSSHDIYSICSSNPDADGTKATTVWCVGVCAN